MAARQVNAVMVRLDPETKSELKRRAALEDRSVSSLVRISVAEHLAKRTAPAVTLVPDSPEAA